MENKLENAGLNITVDDGFQRIPIKNKYGEEIGVFYFNPTDVGIIERYNRLADTFDSITDPLNDIRGIEDATDERVVKALAAARERLNDAVDGLFGGNAAEAFFGRVNPFSPVGDMFYCENVLAAVGQFIGKQFDTATSKLSARVEKYINGKKE